MSRGVRKNWWLRMVLRLGLAAMLLTGLCMASLFVLKTANPPTTALQAQRRVESWFGKASYRKRYAPVPLREISPHLRHAVIAAEDGRFFQHYGVDLEELENAVEEAREGERLRGASTITQQLVKNLYFGASRSVVRKALEWALAPLADMVLGKERVLELYLNVIEWGPGVYGAEAAARFHYKVSASRLSREQSARLAAILPAPLRRKPARMNKYSALILTRMQQMGW